MRPRQVPITAALATFLPILSPSATAKESNESYSYDASGNLIEKRIDGKQTRMSYDSANRLLLMREMDGTCEHFAYDASGRIVGSGSADGKEVRRLEYGYSDKVIRVVSGSGESEFFYNAEGKLVGERAGKQVSVYTWDGVGLAASDDRAFTNECRMIGGWPVLDGPDGDVHVSDYLGSTLLVGGRQFASSAYGEGLEEARYTGKIHVKQLDGYLFPERNYQPHFAGWLTGDPLGYPDGTNNRAYTAGDPVNRVDPLGCSEWSAFVVYQSPAVPPDVVGTPSPPSGSGSPGQVKTTTTEKWDHLQWSRRNSRYGGQGEHLQGGFQYTGGVTASFTINGEYFGGGLSVTATSGSVDTYDELTPANERRAVHAVVSKADHYEMKQDWRWVGGAWSPDGELYWGSTLNAGLFYKNKHGLEYEKQTEL